MNKNFAKRIFLGCLFLAGAGQAAGNTSITESDRAYKALTPAELRSQFELEGEVYATDMTGRILANLGEERSWKFGSKGDLSANWSSRHPNLNEIAVQLDVQLAEDGKMLMNLRQYEWMKRKENGREVETGKLLKEFKSNLKDMAAVSFVVQEGPKERIVIKLNPRLRPTTELLTLRKLPLSLQDVVAYDTKGRVWANSTTLEGEYVSMKTHLGLIALSFTPFKGAKEIGRAEGNLISLNLEGDAKLFLRSGKTILGTSAPAKVFGWVDKSKKSERLNSVHATGSSEEEQFLNRL